MLPHLVLEDNTTQQAAYMLATSVTCAQHGFSSPDLVGSYASAQTDLLSVTSYNKVLYEDIYVRRIAWLAENKPGGLGLSPECSGLNPELPQTVSAFRQRYVELQTSRGNAVADMGYQAGSYRPQAYDFGVPAPSGQVSFGEVAAPSTQHYLVDVGNGQRLCTVSSSGYARCN